PVTDFEHLFQTVRDVEHGDALFTEAANLGEQPVRLRLGQGGGRLVEHDDLDRIGGQHLGDLHELFGRCGQPLDDGVRADVVHAQAVEHGAAPAAQVCAADDPGSGRKPAHKHV